MFYTNKRNKGRIGRRGFLEFTHKTVLLNETLDFLNINKDGVYLDGTAGAGGCSEAIVSKLSEKGKLICLDRDPDAVDFCNERFKDYSQVKVENANFSCMKNIANKFKITEFDGIVLDLGVSSYQLDCAERGFSYNKDAPLDMRMSKSGKTAADLINSLDKESLAHIIKSYGEEKYFERISRVIVNERVKGPILTTLHLAEVIKKAVPAAERREGNPARKTFQALRICVNSELDNLSEGLIQAFSLLKHKGRLAVITFHSLEDRIVKEAMREWSQGCICPPDFPVCTCGKEPKAKIITKSSVKPSESEIQDNPRSRSARLRVCEKI